MTHKSEVGKLGEDLACEYLVKQNYKIIDRNFRKPWGEIDIIAKSKDKTLVFVEVKTIAALPNCRIPDILPEDNLTSAKLKKLQRTASLYTGHYSGLIDEKRGWQIDLIAITLIDQTPQIKHFENI